MRLDIVRDQAGFAALEPAWDVLLEQSAICTPFLRWDWVQLWWEEFNADYELAVAVVRDEAGLPLAIAPLMIGLERDGLRKHLCHLGFLGGLGDVKGERMDFLVPAGREAELTPLLCGAFRLLREEWDAVWLNKLPEESPNRPYVLSALKECSAAAEVLVRTRCVCIPLADRWSDFEKQMCGKQKRKLRRQGELLRAEHAVRECHVTAEDAEERLDEFAKLHQQHYPDGVSSFVTPRAWKFHRRLGQKWLKSGRAILPCMVKGEVMVGGIYGFVERDEFYFYQMGWNAGYARFSLGHLSIRWAVETCMERGLRLFDMLPGTYRYKSEWSDTSRYVLDVEAYGLESLRATIFRSVRGLKRLVVGASQTNFTE